MSVEFLDGFAHYATTNIYQKYNHPGGTITNSYPAGRSGPNAMLLGQSNGAVGMTLSHQSAWVTGFAVYFDRASTNGDLMTVYHNGKIMCKVRTEADLTLSVYAAESVLISNSAPFAIHQNTWYYMENKFEISGSTSTPVIITSTLRVDSTLRASGTGTTAFNTTALLLQTPTANRFEWDNIVVSGTTFLKDLYVFNQSGGDTNSFAGDCTFIYVVPDGDVTTQWVPSSGTTHFNLVNEVPPDDDASYIQTTSTGSADNFTWQDIPAFSGSIIAVQYLGYARKTGEGQRSFKLTVGSVGAYTQESEQFYVNDNYVYYRMPLGTDPATSTQWTRAGFNATLFGVHEIT